MSFIMDFLIASHASKIKGPIDYFEEYILSKGHISTKITHPLDNYSGRNTAVTFNGNKTANVHRSDIGILNYLYDIYLTLREIKLKNFDVYVGANNFDTFVGWMGKKILNRYYKIVYLASDFSENRFHNKFLDSIYILLEKLVVKKSDVIISNTYRAEQKRLTLGLKKSKSVVMPNLFQITKPLSKNKNIDKNSFIYVGNVTGEHGLLELVTFLRPSIKKLVVIGDGDQWGDLIKMIKKFHIHSKIYRAKEHNFVMNYLKDFNGFGLAPYNDKEKWTYYCSPLKIYEYILSGIPIITSDRTEISEQVEKEKLGLVYKNGNYNDIVKKINNFSTYHFYQKSREFYSMNDPHIIHKMIIKKLEGK